MQNNYFTKNSLWKNIVLYIVIAAVAYGLVYVFFLGKGGDIYNSQQSQTYEQTTPPINNDQELMSASQSLDATDVDASLDGELNQNDADASAF